ncbi:hypothetical protein [Methylocystis sp.]|uniref:hypothetical protein n=1 Tax=Methylocystis sp. TaxID=1911079 RepID=UPI002735998A|nr:hypothetical protein [Methylocystis sp.]MDP3553086.1 hypothetical protein [Methylocystis sp.]
MNTTSAANLNNFLNRLPPNAPPAVPRNIETAVRLSERFHEKAAEIRANTRLSAEGKAEQVRAALSTGFSDHLSQLRKEIGGARAGIANEVGGLRKRAVELVSDGYGPELRREVRGYLRTLEANERRRLAFESEDRLIQASILEAPAFLSGLDEQAYSVIEQRVVEGAFGKRLAELEIQNGSWEHADTVCKIVTNELAREAEINPTALEKQLAA